MSLEAARVKAGTARSMCAEGVDPIDARERMLDAARLEAATALTFDDCTSRFIEAKKAGWRSARHIVQWTNTLKDYAGPVFGNMPVQTVNTALVMKVLEPLWATKPETASRLRGRIERVLDWAKVRGYRKGENPARWKDHLANLLPPKGKVRKVKHHAAMAIDDLPGFMVELRKQDGNAAKALEFTILTAARTGEALGAKPAEIDREGAVWTVPGERMKTYRAHRVPLSPRALAILNECIESNDAFLFPGLGAGKPLSSISMLGLLERMGHEGLTVHGFRSTFRDWAAERTSYPREAIEIALSHTLADKTEAAYARSDLLDRRRPMMEAWAKFCNTPIADKGSKVLPMKRQG